MTISHVLVSVTGPDGPGITARLTGLVAAGDAQLLDIEQVVVQGHLTLALLIAIPEEKSVLKELLFAAKELGVELDFEPVEAPSAKGDADVVRWVINVIAPQLGARALHEVAAVVAEHGGNIEKIARLSEGYAMTSVEVQIGLPRGSDDGALRQSLLQLGSRGSFDVALQREGLFRRSKRLVVMDMDSTLIRIEVIDELARAHGVEREVAAITERAMAGEMDYDESLRQRLALLRGLDVRVLERIAEELPLTDGAELLIRVLRRLGYKTAVISGGFTVAADALKRRLGIDYAYSNRLEIEGGKLTGRVIGPIVNGRRKAELLEVIAQAEGVLLDQVIAVGDGANDLLMLEKAGLGIAFRAKQKLREAADSAISTSGLEAILHLLGLRASEVAEVARDRGDST